MNVFKGLIIGGGIILFLNACTSEPKKTIVCWGDSLTASHANRPGMKNAVKRWLQMEVDDSYPGVLQGILGDDYEVVNCGVPGAGASDIMHLQQDSANAMRDLRGQSCNIFFIGQNGAFSNTSELVEQISSMIDYSECSNYIVISFHKPNLRIPTPARMSGMEDTLQYYFGEHYINLRSHLIQNGLDEAGMTATQEDLDSIAHGQVPPQLMEDGLHFKPQGYAIIARLVADKIKSLHY